MFTPELIEKARTYFTDRARGSDDSKTVRQFAAHMELKDLRVARDLIHELRTTYNMAIISSSSGTGYFLLDTSRYLDIQIAEHFIAETLHRADQTRDIISSVKTALEKRDQLDLLPASQQA